MRALLDETPSDSRGLVRALEAGGFTAKQIRVARLALGVIVTRTGSGAASRSFWALPATGQEFDPAGAVKRVVEGGQSAAGTLPALEADVATEAATGTPLAEADPVPAAGAGLGGLTDAERQRFTARAAEFHARGMSRSEASALALRLMGERDRRNLFATGSCIECQIRDECASVRPWQEVHQCWERRPNCP